MSDYIKTFPPLDQMNNDRPFDLEIPVSSRSYMSRTPSTSTLPGSQARSSYTGSRRNKQTTTRRSHPYDFDYRLTSKGSTAYAQGASDERPRGLSMARPGDDSLKYAQGLALHPPSGSSGGGVHPLQTPWANAFQIAGGSLTHGTLYPPSLIGPTTTPSAHQAQSLPQSLAFAAQLAESQSLRAPTAHSSVPTSPASVRPVVPRPDSSQQDERNRLAELLHVHLQTNPVPIIGSPNNPFPFADPLGMRGLPIFSAFFEETDTETYTCTFCGDVQTDIEVALNHQSRYLQTCVDV